MSLNPWEEQALESISDRLTKTDPKLATLLDTFSRLTAGEHMPVRETVRRRPRRQPARRARRARRHVQRTGPGPAMLLLWLAVSLTLIAVAVVLSHGGSHPGCTVALPLACASSGHATPVSHAPPG